MITKIFGLLLVGVVAEAATLSTIPGKMLYQPGESVTVNVALASVSDLYAFQFDISFNPTILAAQSIIGSGYFLSNGISFSPGTIDNTSGRISFIADTLSGNAPTLTGSTTLASITFTAVGPGTTSIAPANIILLDSSLTDIFASSNGATVQITNTPEPGSYTLIGLGVLLLVACGKLRIFRAARINQ